MIYWTNQVQIVSEVFVCVEVQCSLLTLETLKQIQIYSGDYPIKNVFANIPEAERHNNSVRVMKSGGNINFTNRDSIKHIGEKKNNNLSLPPLNELASSKLGSSKFLQHAPNPMLKRRRDSKEIQLLNLLNLH